MKGLETFELFIDEDKEGDGIQAISLVEFPAIEENFIALSKHKVEFKTVDTEKRIIVGLALVPDKPIYRRKGEYEYNVIFSKETVRKASELYLKSLKLNNATLEHGEQMAKGVSVIESWIVEDPKKDKTAIYGLNAVEGAWAVTMKIDNDAVWEDVKAGKYLGLSIEGMFSDGSEEVDASEVKMMEYPHLMYDPSTGDVIEIVDEAMHIMYTEKGWVHEDSEEYKRYKEDLDTIEQLKKLLS